MSAFFFDIWHDLREKRLLPVAIALLVAMAIALLALPKSPDEGAELPPGATAPSGVAGLPTVNLAGEAIAGRSRLDAFDPKNPFLPLEQGNSDGEGLPMEVNENLENAGKALGSALASTLGGGEEGFAETLGSTSSSGSDPFGGSGGGGSTGGSGAAPTPVGAPDTKTRVRNYTYTLDLLFGEAGNVRERRGVELLEMLPSRDRPLLTFVGVKDGKEAVFLVDPELIARGEGRCEPSPQRCQFLFLGTDEGSDEHFFVDPAGRDYKLQLLDINAVSVDSLDRDGRSARRSRASARTARARAARRARRAYFSMPVFWMGSRR